MAKGLNTNFDADSFIEEFRESSVPTYHTAADTKSETEAPAPEKPAKRPKPPDKPEIKYSDTKCEREVFDFDGIEDENVYENLNMTTAEVEYIKNFVVRNNFRQVSSKGKQVMIRDRYRKLIVHIQHLLGDEGNMATYIDNVLTQHFKEYYSTMVSISKKCPSQF